MSNPFTSARYMVILLPGGLLIACSGSEAGDPADPRFTIAVIPDTQNYLDYIHQLAEGFALEMAADDEMLAWASEVIGRHPGHPTIITTHD